MRIQIIGGGSWGLAIARLLALNGHAVRMWCRPEDQPDTLRQTRRSPFFLPEMRLPDQVEVLQECDAAAELVVLAAPSHAMRAVAGVHALPSGAIRVNVAKGIENDTLRRMSEIIAEVAPGGPVVTLSGPSHAEEVAQDLPASVVAAGHEESARNRVQDAFFAPTFRVYTSADIVGVELGGALKNVIAIAAGVCDGLALGDNAKAALMTRGLAEMARLGAACGADPATFAGLSGMGDLIVTCGSRHSRNRRLGEAIARGQTLEEYTASSPMVAEGVRSTISGRALARKMGVELPVADAVYHVLFEGVAPREAVTRLMMRKAKPE